MTEKKDLTSQEYLDRIGCYSGWILRTPGYEMHDNFHVTEVVERRLAFEPWFFKKQFIRPTLWVRSDYLRGRDV